MTLEELEARPDPEARPDFSELPDGEHIVVHTKPEGVHAYTMGWRWPFPSRAAAEEAVARHGYTITPDNA